MTTAPGSADSPPMAPLLDRPVRSLPPVVRVALGHLVLALIIGLLTGVLWNRIVSLPRYVLGDNGVASMTERDLAHFFTTDFWYSVIGLVVGVGLGVWTWWRSGRRGWVVVPLAVVASLVAALVCWWVGVAMDPANFDERLSAASPGQSVPVDFTLEAVSAVALWPLGAVIPLMLASALLPENAERGGGGWRRRRLARPSQASIAAGSRPAMPGGPTVRGNAPVTNPAPDAPSLD